MACFLVPAAEAVFMTAVTKAVSAKEREAKVSETSGAEHGVAETGGISWSVKLRWLTNLLWGGVVLLMYEHIWHGEVVPFFPFLTAAVDPGERAEMLYEMATSGVGMALLVTLVWGIIVLAVSVLEKHAFADPEKAVR